VYTKSYQFCVCVCGGGGDGGGTLASHEAQIELH